MGCTDDILIFIVRVVTSFERMCSLYLFKVIEEFTAGTLKNENLACPLCCSMRSYNTDHFRFSLMTLDVIEERSPLESTSIAPG